MGWAPPHTHKLLAALEAVQEMPEASVELKTMAEKETEAMRAMSLAQISSLVRYFRIQPLYSGGKKKDKDQEMVGKSGDPDHNGEYGTVEGGNGRGKSGGKAGWGTTRCYGEGSADNADKALAKVKEKTEALVARIQGIERLKKQHGTVEVECSNTSHSHFVLVDSTTER